MLVGTNDQDPEQLRRALVELENPSLSEHKTVVFPEYANRNLRSLLFELRDVVPAEQRSEVGNAYDRSIGYRILHMGNAAQAVSNQCERQAIRRDLGAFSTN